MKPSNLPLFYKLYFYEHTLTTNINVLFLYVFCVYVHLCQTKEITDKPVRKSPHSTTKNKHPHWLIMRRIEHILTPACNSKHSHITPLSLTHSIKPVAPISRCDGRRRRGGIQTNIRVASWQKCQETAHTHTRSHRKQKVRVDRVELVDKKNL